MNLKLKLVFHKINIFVFNKNVKIVGIHVYYYINIIICIHIDYQGRIYHIYK